MTADGGNNHWTLAVGDPTVGGWLTTLLYLLAAAAAWQVYLHAGAAFVSRVRRQRLLWLLFALALLLLGLNKQLDLHVLMLEKARQLALAMDWYEQRRLVQVGFIKAAALVSVLLLMLFVVLYRAVFVRHLLAIVGLCLLAAYAIIRVTLFQTPDVLWWHFRLGFKINWLLECIGLVCILLNAGWLVRAHWWSKSAANQVES